jgi:hypothetical protein
MGEVGIPEVLESDGVNFAQAGLGAGWHSRAVNYRSRAKRIFVVISQSGNSLDG